MEKSKLGISVALFSVLLFLIGAVGTTMSSFTAIVIAVGYVLFIEENLNLKKTAIKALIITIVLSLVSYFVMWLVQFLSTIFATLSGYASIGADYESYDIVRFFSFLQAPPQFLNIIMRVLQVLILIILGFRAYRQKEIGLKWIDRILEKHFNT